MAFSLQTTCFVLFSLCGLVFCWIQTQIFSLKYLLTHTVVTEVVLTAGKLENMTVKLVWFALPEYISAPVFTLPNEEWYKDLSALNTKMYNKQTTSNEKCVGVMKMVWCYFVKCILSSCKRIYHYYFTKMSGGFKFRNIQLKYLHEYFNTFHHWEKGVLRPVAMIHRDPNCFSKIRSRLRRANETSVMPLHLSI